MYDQADFDCLMSFLRCGPESSLPVLERFAQLQGAYAFFDGGKRNFVYIPGTRPDRVLLVAHADTVWDREYLDDEEEVRVYSRAHEPCDRYGVISQKSLSKWGIGADDRAGCAMLWLLRDSGHSLLITDGEEHGQIGANYIRARYPRIFDELNGHAYMIQLDRRNGSDYKTYRIPVSDEFRRYIEKHTGFTDAGRTSRTDIAALCRRVAGVNLSVGYHNEHTAEEYLDLNEWRNTLDILRNLLRLPQPRFPLPEETPVIYTTDLMEHIHRLADEGLTIRPEEPDDCRAVENLVREAFWNVYRPGCTEHCVLHALRRDPAFVRELDYVMEKDGRIIGQNVFMRTVILSDDGREIPVLTMGPICTDPEFMGQGYGGDLLDYCLARAEEMAFGAVLFEGAIGFYGQHGFTYAREFGIRYHDLPEGADDSFFLCRELVPGYLSGVTGVYQTPPAYYVSDEEAEAFDSTFPPKEKRRQPGQLL